MRSVFRHTFFALSFLLIASSTQAAEFGLFNFDVRGGFVVEDALDNGYVLGVSANVAELTDGLFLYPALTYGEVDIGFDPFFGRNREVTSLALGLEVRYFLSQERQGWYFGGGPYLHFIERDTLVPRVFPTTDPFDFRVERRDEEEFGPMGVAGYQFGQDGRGWLVELRASGVSSFDGFQLLGGFSF